MRDIQIGHARLIEGDSLRVMREMDAATLDGLITDPPYSSGGQFRSDRQKSPNQKYILSPHRGRHADFSGDNRDQRAYAWWCYLWLSEILRLLRPGAPFVIFCDWRQMPLMTDAIQAGGLIWRGIAVWDKTRGCRPAKGRFRQQAEFMLWGTKGPMAAYSDAPALPGVFTCAPLKGGKFHVTGKPVDLMNDVLPIVSPGGIVLDPFMGSGSTGVACLRTGRRFIGIEQETGYVDIAVRRLRAESPETSVAVNG